MESIVKVRSRRGKRSRPVVYDKPEKSTLTPFQFAFALVILTIAASLAYRMLVY